jgi:hypothetical protein
MKMHNLLDLLYFADHGFNYLYVITRKADHVREDVSGDDFSTQGEISGSTTTQNCNTVLKRWW